MDEITDLKGFLRDQMEMSKRAATIGATDKNARPVKQGVMKVGDYSQLEKNFDM
jgi:hypothetical protein